MGYAQSVEQQTDSLLNVVFTAEDDSIKVETYFDIAQLNLYQYPHKTVQYCHELITLCENIGDYETIAAAHTLIFNAQLYYGASADSLRSASILFGLSTHSTF